MKPAIGTIAVGKKADFVLLAENPFKIDPKKIKDINIYSTVFEGKEFKIDGTVTLCATPGEKEL